MTKRERQLLTQAITHLMSDDPDGFTAGMDILFALTGKKPRLPRQGQVEGPGSGQAVALFEAGAEHS